MERNANEKSAVRENERKGARVRTAENDEEERVE